MVQDKDRLCGAKGLKYRSLSPIAGTSMPVTFNDILPSLFEEGQGMVGQGYPWNI
jgi:cytochrome c-type biogenesis protein CcmE